MEFRYRNEDEMKDSGVEWIGKIPKESNIIKMKYCTKFVNGYAFKSDDLQIDKDVPVVRIGDIKESGLHTSKALKIDNKIAENLQQYRVKINDVLIAMSGATVGKTMQINNYYNVLINQRVGIIRSNNINPNFLFYNVTSSKFKEEILLTSVGGAQENISSENILNKDIVNLSTGEQEKIEKFLGEKTAQFDAITSKKEDLIKRLEEAKKSLMCEVVTGRVKVVKTSTGYELLERKKEEMKDSGVEWMGYIPREWKVKKIKYATEIFRGKFNHRPRNDPDYYDGIHPFIQTGDVASAGMFLENYVQTLNDKGYSVSKEFSKGTLVMTIAANIGDLSILKIDACFPDSIIGFLPREKIEVKYLYYCFMSMKAEFMSTAIINTQMNLNVERVANLLMPISLNEEQKNIATYLELALESINNIICKTKEQIKNIKEAKQSLISEAVTGKIEILD